MIIAKKHITADNRLILAICDKELLGNKYEENDVLLDLSSDFYNGEELSDEELKSLIPKAYSINTIGEKSVAICISLEVIEQDHVKKIKDIPYAYMVRM